MSNPKTVRIQMMISAERADYLESVLCVGNEPGDDTHPALPAFVEELIAKLQNARHQLNTPGINVTGTGFDLMAIDALPAIDPAGDHEDCSETIGIPGVKY